MVKPIIYLICVTILCSSGIIGKNIMMNSGHDLQASTGQWGNPDFYRKPVLLSSSRTVVVFDDGTIWSFNHNTQEWRKLPNTPQE